MRKIILTLVFSLFCINLSIAEVYVYTDKNTKEVIFLSERDDVVIDRNEKNIREDIIPHNIEFYNLTEGHENYKFSNNKFTFNTQKETKKQDRINADKASKEKKDLDFESAKAKLIGLGLTSDEVDSLK